MDRRKCNQSPADRRIHKWWKTKTDRLDWRKRLVMPRSVAFRMLDGTTMAADAWRILTNSLWVLWRSVLSILFHQPSLFLYIVDKNKDDRTNIIKTVFDHWRRTSKRVRGLYGTVEWIWMSQSYRIWSWNEWSWRWWWSWWRWWWCGGGSSHRRPSSKSEKRRRRGVSSPGIRNDARDVFLYILSSSPPCGS